MLKVNRSIMETCKFVVILLLYCVTTAYCYPAEPLDERPQDRITWQAWLLFDDQNQNKQQTNDDGMKRRITAKSVFIAPTFSPESLPPCADGYKSDVMGRCVPIIKLDEDAHYGFLIERLKQKFGNIDYGDYQDEDEVTTQGPLQLNIPLQEEDEDEEMDVAIVISPTNPLDASVGKRDSIDDQKKQEMFLKNLAVTTTEEPEETTTFRITITESNSETGTVTADSTSVTEPLTTTADVTTSTSSHNTKRSTDDTEQDIITTTEELPDTTTVVETTTIQSREVSTLAPKLLVPKPEQRSPINFKFPEVKVTENYKGSFVKFPDTNVSFQTQIPSSVESGSSTRETSNDAPFSELTDASVSDRKVVFRDQSQPEVANLDYSNGVRQLPPTTTQRIFNRRNRDKSNNMFLLPPRWSQSNFQKPLVLRFSRKHAYLDEAHFRHPDYYRSMPMDDYAFLFSKHRQSGHR